MQTLTKGGNAQLTAGRITIRVEAAGSDVSAYLLDVSGKVRGDEDMIFYNQPGTHDGSIRLDGSVFQIDLQRVEKGVERIAVCAVPERGNIGAIGNIGFRIDGAASYSERTAGMSEAAIILAELYRRNGAWKVRAVAQGFNGGLAPLSRHFGIEVAEDTQPQPAPAPTSAPSIPIHTPAPSTVSLKKVTLQKAGKVDLRKGGGAIRARLVWDGRSGGEGDLDLYCFYVLKDGTCGKVYWKDLGRDHAAPWITLSGDSQKAGEEEIVLHRPDALSYALFAAYSAIGNGAGSFAGFRPKMVMTDQDGSEVTVPLLNPNETSYWVAISHLTIGETITIEHVETYGKSGLRAWIAAERSPRLHKDGTWDVSKGPIEFKRN